MNRDFTRPLNTTFYCGLSLLLISILFRVQHWPYGIYLFWGGFLLQLGFSVFMFIEVFSSRKAGWALKAGWSIAYAGILAGTLPFTPYYVGVIGLVVPGNIYLRWARRKFVTLRSKFFNVEFDSIQV